MDRALVLLFLLSLAFLSIHGCLPGYETLWNGKCIKMLEDEFSCELNVVGMERAKCQRDGAHLTVIRSEEVSRFYSANLSKYNFFHDNTELTQYMVRLYKGVPVYLDLSCNFVTGNWQWYDGTTAAYLNFANQTLNHGACSSGYSVYMYPGGGGNWLLAPEDSAGCQWYFLCQERDMLSDPDCGAFTPIGTEDADACLMIHTAKVSRAEGEKICRNQNADLASIHGKEENDFVRRYALGQSLVEDFFIGTSLIVGSKNYSWVDGSPFNYSNFGKGSPNAAVGLCIAMDVSERGGPWTSVDCESKLAFGCTRPTVDNTPILAPPHCPVPEKFGVGDHIYSPNFPKGIVTGLSCDYVVTVPSGQMVDLETNINRDTLYIYDGTFDDTLLYNITGSNHAGERFVSKSSSTLRLRFAPTDGKGVRGWHLLVHAQSCTNC